MITNYREITGKYLKANKKRTVLTLIGIILSVALISAIGFFLESMQEAQVQDMKNTYGSWHVMYEKVDEKLITKIKSNPSILRSGTYSEGEEFIVNENLRAKEVYGSDEGLALLPFKLKEGRFPDANGEVALEKWFIDRIGSEAKLGEKIAIAGKEYTLVGILNNTYTSQINSLGQILIMDPNHQGTGKILLAELKRNRKLMENIDELRKLTDNEYFKENSSLIAAQGYDMLGGLLAVVVIIIGIVIISTVAVIYNAFQIGVVDRIKQFGLLRAVGATPKQIRKIILREAGMLSIIGIPIGLVFGVVALYGIYFTFNLISGEGVLFIYPKISLTVIIISIVIGILSIFMSALLPAIFAGRISPLLAISSRSSITKEKLKKRKSFIMGRLFGFEGTMASRNIRRNRKRYRITVFSIIISVTLFVSFKSFVDMSLNVYDELNESNNIHFSVYQRGSETEKGIEKRVIEGIEGLSQVDVVYRMFPTQEMEAVVDRSKEISEIRDIGTVYNNINYNGIEKILIESSLAVYDDKSLEVAKSYLREGNIDIETLNRENGVIIIAKNWIFNPKTENVYYGQVVNLKPGDEILLQGMEFTDDGNKKFQFGEGKVQSVKVLAVLNGNPFNFNGRESGIKMVTTEDVAERLTSMDLEPTRLNIKIKDEKLEEEAQKGIEALVNSTGGLTIVNHIDQERTTRGTVLMVKILLYGFVIVVSLIGSVNIINTITTNIILRRRELAALKSIGLTQRGLRKMITLEGILYGIVGSLYGSAIGCLLSYLLFMGINDMREQSYRIPVDSIVIATAGAILIGYLSVLAPLRRIRKDNLIEAVREEF